MILAKNTLHLVSLSVIYLTTLGCQTVATRQSAVKDGDGNGYNCVHTQPITGDGYSRFYPVDANKVKRRIMNSQGQQVDDDQKVIWPNQDQINESMRRIGGFNNYIDQRAPGQSGERRHEVYKQGGFDPRPYCLFHAANEPIYGTVILFHGYNDRPQQQAALASYLFHSGFNIYNVPLANHWMVPGTTHWPKTVYRREVIDLISKKLADANNQQKIAIIKKTIESMGTEATKPENTAAIAQMIDEILQPELSHDVLGKAWQNPDGPEFRKLYNFNQESDNRVPGDFRVYIRDAQDRLEEVAPLNGPVFVTGLSVGATVAMALAEEEATGRHRIHAVMTHAPWLSSVSPDAQGQIVNFGPLDDQVGIVGGQYPLNWENHHIDMSPANISANAALGAYVQRPDRVKNLANIPTAFVTTAVEVSANNAATEAMYNQMNIAKPGESLPTAGLHRFRQYDRNHGVGHAMTDPENYRGENPDGSDGNHWNIYWRTLYQETYRFFLTGDVVDYRLYDINQDVLLPQVECAITGEFAYRCNR